MFAKTRKVTRRKALLWATVVATSVAPARAKAGTGRFRAVDLHFESGIPEARIARVLLPSGLDRSREVPVVVLLHGYGPAGSEPRSLAAWTAEYGIERAYEQLSSPPLEPLGRERCLSGARCSALNASLEGMPFQGMVLVCPRTLVPYNRPAALKDYSAFLSDQLLSGLSSVLSIRIGGVGLAGVSMGGRVGLEVMAERPSSFQGFVGLQSHVEPGEVTGYAQRLSSAFARSGPRQLLLHSSSEDPYLAANRALSEALHASHVEHDFQVSPGPHTAEWMREVGSLETLFWHDRRLLHKK